ncbi:amidohydrolase [Galbibacter sp. BG1]|uniref:M20 metallopeptidase family protein n=1 Tax=Galbibacter sp. BG1 TaxID=1170699 RepID=UPI0015B7CCB2|nr:M20 family metallopeptidase [Galbibacter sp. BG1]QLE00428.1 amidohydrolase [Galbibacter sp. BG1]
MIKKTLFVAFLIFLQSIFSQNEIASSISTTQIEEKTATINDSLIKIRRDLHKYPELAGNEKRTSEKVAAYLEALGLEVHKNIGGYGVVGVLQGRDGGKKIAWRADMDALSSTAPDPVEFKSENKGIRHICGHDVHTTIGLGIANVLSSLKEDWAGTMYFIFQPSEENYQGAQEMLSDGIMEIIDPDEIYALHVTAFPQGYTAVKAQNPYSFTNRLDVIYKTTKDLDEITEFTKKLVKNHVRIPADARFSDYNSLGDPEVGIASAQTIFTDYLTLASDFKVEENPENLKISVYVNSSNKKQLDSLLSDLKLTIKKSKFANTLEQVIYTNKKGTVVNDEALTAKAIESISKAYGKSKIIPLYGVIPGNVGDDFSYFQDEIPGVYFFLGGSNFEKGIIANPHAPNFMVDEACIQTGVELFSSFLLDRL